MNDNIHPKLNDIQLIIDDNDIMIKHFVAGVWKGLNPFNGFSLSTSLKIDAVKIFEKDKNLGIARLDRKNNIIFVEFSRPILQNEKYVYELQILPDPNAIIQKIGQLNILEWPKEDLSEIIFLKNAGNIFFSSALAEIAIDPKTLEKRIKPDKFAKYLTSHAKKSSAIRIEWGNSAPIYRLHFEYIICNRGANHVSNVKIFSYVPPNTKFQNVTNNLNEIGILSADEDGNNIIEMKLDLIKPAATEIIEFFIDISPIGNSSMFLPNFGEWNKYRSLTQPGSIGYKMLSSSKYWPLEDNIIKNLILTLKKHSKNASEFINLAFEFVNQKIKYEINGKRDDALETMNTRKGDCSEMSDLLVCILRGGGIPAKIVHGWTINIKTNQLEPHSWCEFFSPKAGGWIQSDPTWGYLLGVSCQHICRQREGLIPDQNTYIIEFRGDSKIDIKEKIRLDLLPTI